MSIPNPPPVRALPPTPSRANAADGDEFSALMDNHLATLPLWSGDLADLGQWTFERATDIAQAVQQVQSIQAAVSTLGDQKIQAASQQADRARDEADRAADEAGRAQSVADSVGAQTNFKGPWGAAVGPASVPSSYLHNSQYWNLLTDIPDIALVEPGTDGTVWAPAELGSASVGDLIYSAADLSTSGFLPLDQAATYLQSAYPALFALTGLGLPQFSGLGAIIPFPGAIGGSNNSGMLLSNTGAYLAIGVSSDNAVYILETASWTLVHTINTTLALTQSTRNQMSWSFNDEFFRVQDDSNNIHRVSDWQAVSASAIFGVANPRKDGGFCFSPTERKIFAVGNPDTSEKWLIEFDSSLGVVGSGLLGGVVSTMPRSPEFNPAGDMIAVDAGNYVNLITVSYTPTVTGIPGTFLSGWRLSWSPDGRYLAGKAQVFDVSVGQALSFFALQNSQSAFWASDSKTVFFTESQTSVPAVAAFDVTTETERSDISVPNGACASGTMSPNDQYLIYLDSTGPKSIAVYPMDPSTEFYLAALAPVTLESPSTVSFTPYIKAEG